MTGWTQSTVRFCLLLVLVLWATQGLCAKKKPPLHPVNLNTATSEELQEVPGIGPATAEKILQARKSYGAFKSVDDLHQGNRPQTPGKNAQVSNGQQASSEPEALHASLRHCEEPAV